MFILGGDVHYRLGDQEKFTFNCHHGWVRRMSTRPVCYFDGLLDLNTGLTFISASYCYPPPQWKAKTHQTTKKTYGFCSFPASPLYAAGAFSGLHLKFQVCKYFSPAGLA